MAVITDENAAWCSTCRDGNHGMCSSDTCECPDARKHRRRPSFGSRKSATKPASPRRRSPRLAVVPDDEINEEPEDVGADDEVIDGFGEVDVVDQAPGDDDAEWGTLDEALRQVVEYKVLALWGGGAALQVRIKELG